jgi:class 3 adenylate cyclase
VRASLAETRGYAGEGVSGYPRQEVAQRAGVDPDYIDRLVELGILTPDTGGEYSPGAAADLATTLATLVRQCSQEHDGTPVKWLGDGVMFYFREPANAVLAALAMTEAVGRHGLPPAHVGIHAGPVIFQDGDYYGRTVNLAARIAEYARPGEVLVSQEVVDAAEEGPVRFTEIGPVELKGVPGTLRLYIAGRGA